MCIVASGNPLYKKGEKTTKWQVTCALQLKWFTIEELSSLIIYGSYLKKNVSSNRAT
jgi:hypothetical protein